jgi:hypothetical protein
MLSQHFWGILKINSGMIPKPDVFGFQFIKRCAIWSFLEEIMAILDRRLFED